MIDINVASSPVYTVNINLIYLVDKPDRYQPLTSPVYTVYLKFILSNILGFLFVCQITKKNIAKLCFRYEKKSKFGNYRV